MSAMWSSFGQARTIGPITVQEVVEGFGLGFNGTISLVQGGQLFDIGTSWSQVIKRPIKIGEGL